MKVIEYFIPLALLALAAVLMGKAWSHWQAVNALLEGTRETEGTVVGMTPYIIGKAGKGKLVYFPDVEFVTAEGERIRFRARESRRADHFRKGDSVPVRYRPEAPREAVLATFSALWSLPLIYAGGGLLLLLFGGWFLRRAVKSG